MPFKCDQCGKDFNTEQGLAQHRLDKHGISSHEKKEMKKQEQEKQKSETVKKAKSGKMIKYAAIAVIIVAIIGVAYYFLSNSSSGGNNQNSGSSNDNILSTNLYSHNALALHIHPHLEMEINGQVQEIPQGIGVSPSVMRVIHTHDGAGKLHVESPVPHTFKLQDFFTIWGRNFNSSCIFDYCNNETHELRMTVNGQPSTLYGELPLKDLDNIKIIYGPRAQ